MKLRLLLTEECNRTCKLCCNKNFDMGALPVCRSFKGYDEVMITGGEPLLKPELLFSTIEQIRAQTTAPIYVYTAYRENPYLVAALLRRVDGITLTLHTKHDVPAFGYLTKMLTHLGLNTKALRVNVFKGIDISDIDTSSWLVKPMVWVKDCPVPYNEVFMRVAT